MADIFLVLGATVAAFLLGSLPFAVWLGRLVARSDVRSVGDGNPGTANAFKVGGWKTGVPTLFLEVGKAGLPVSLATASFGPHRWALAPVALAPIFGHAFSPFLRMRGGKAIAASFGSWIALTGFLYPLVLGLAMGVCFAVQSVHAWAVLGGTLLFGVFLLVVGSPAVVLFVWAINSGLLAWTHRKELSLEFVPRSWLPLGRTKDRRT
jgi:glycerol-3-phosphate acyltransferase PlsY